MKIVFLDIGGVESVLVRDRLGVVVVVRPPTDPSKIHTCARTAFAPPGGGGPNNGGDGKGNGGGALGMLGKLLTAGAARVAVAGAVASLAVGLQLAPPGSFQLYHTVGEVPAVAFREVSASVGWLSNCGCRGGGLV